MGINPSRLRYLVPSINYTSSWIETENGLNKEPDLSAYLEMPRYPIAIPDGTRPGDGAGTGPGIAPNCI
jgi:hypothetical protein